MKITLFQVDGLAQVVKEAVQKQDMLAWRFNTVGMYFIYNHMLELDSPSTIGVSDAITMGSDGMRFSLQTREIIADSIETVTCAQVFFAT